MIFGAGQGMWSSSRLPWLLEDWSSQGSLGLTGGVSPHQVQDGEEVGRALDAGDQVELSVVVNRKLGTTMAEAVKLLCKAEDKRGLGQVGLSSGSPLAITVAALKPQTGRDTSQKLLLGMKRWLFCMVTIHGSRGHAALEVRSHAEPGCFSVRPLCCTCR